MATQLLVLAAALAVAHAGYLSNGYIGGSPGNNGAGSFGTGSYGNGAYGASSYGVSSYGGNPFGGSNGPASPVNGPNYYNNAPLALNPGPLPQTQSQSQVVAPLRYAPAPPLASSSTFRHQISVSQPQVVQVPVAVGPFGQANRGLNSNIGSAYGGSSVNGGSSYGYPYRGY